MKQRIHKNKRRTKERRIYQEEEQGGRETEKKKNISVYSMHILHVLYYIVYIIDTVCSEQKTITADYSRQQQRIIYEANKRIRAENKN